MEIKRAGSGFGRVQRWDGLASRKDDDALRWSCELAGKPMGGPRLWRGGHVRTRCADGVAHTPARTDARRDGRFRTRAALGRAR